MNERIPERYADYSRLIRAMEAAGYYYDQIESTPDNLRFFGETGSTMTMTDWKECEDWLNGVVFDDPQISDSVGSILHSEQNRSVTDIFHTGRPEQNPTRALEDYLEQNDNAFDGIINNMLEPAGTTPSAQTDFSSNPAMRSSSIEKEECRESVLEQLRSQRKAENPSCLEKTTSYKRMEHEERNLTL